MSAVQTMTRDQVRIYVTGSCEGLDSLREALATHSELDFVGWSEHVADATAALAGGHLQVVVHATGEATFPAGEIAAIREQTRAPIVLVASGESHGDPRGGARRRRRRRRPAPPAADRERRLRAAQGRPCRPPPRSEGARARTGGS